MTNLERAIGIAVRAHAGQEDKNGEPYILHPLRVMLDVSPAARIPAILHDVVEDTKVTLEDLTEAGFTRDTVKAIELLTRPTGVAYDEYIRSFTGGKHALDPRHIAREVKMADLRDNTKLERLPSPITERDLRRHRKYTEALAYLQTA